MLKHVVVIHTRSGLETFFCLLIDAARHVPNSWPLLVPHLRQFG